MAVGGDGCLVGGRVLLFVWRVVVGSVVYMASDRDFSALFSALSLSVADRARRSRLWSNGGLLGDSGSAFLVRPHKSRDRFFNIGSIALLRCHGPLFDAASDYHSTVVFHRVAAELGACTMVTGWIDSGHIWYKSERISPQWRSAGGTQGHRFHGTGLWDYAGSALATGI